MSAFKRRSSSTDSQDIEISVVEHGPRYFLRTSNAGTLVVCEESFRNRKVRRRPRSCPRVPEVDETTSQMQSTPPIGQERVLQKFTYPSTTQIYQSNDNLNRYDEAIARIDKLISNVSLKRDPAFGGDYDKSGQKVGKYRSVGDVRMKDETISSGSRVGSAPSVICAVWVPGRVQTSLQLMILSTGKRKLIVKLREASKKEASPMC
ncbi:unnamed protein product [Hermetia illucens]|uniref:Uncharacterized protein n=1 Tax=Hermetia illucens TaxID=343691 RepID=A0A7R8YMX1_HERIL|nr:unnamed protein product [Hermetia illucens]